MKEKELMLVGVNKKYKLDGKKTFQALYDVNVEFAKGELVSIIGESGSGKSTLMNLIGGLDSDFTGDIIAGGENLRTLSDKQLDKYRKNKVGFVFQSFNLISHLSILDNVTLALTLSNVSEKEKVERATKILRRVGLSSQLKKKPTQLSGGQKQRVAIARALINDPEIIIADEPTGALDSQTSMQILQILKEIADSGKLVIMVTHSEKVASISSRVVEISDGRIISDKVNENYQKEVTEKDFSVETEKLETQEENEKADLEQKPVTKRKKINFKDKQNLSLWSAIRLSFHNMWASKTKNILMSIGVAIGIGSLILMMCFSSGITDFIHNTMKSYSDPTIVTISKKPKDGANFINMDFDPFKEEERLALYEDINKYLEDEGIDFHVEDKYSQGNGEGNVSYGFNLMTFAFDAHIYFSPSGKDIKYTEEFLPDGTKNPEYDFISEQIYCLYTIPPYYTKQNVIDGKLSEPPTAENGYKGGFMFTQGINKMLESPVGKNVQVSFALPIGTDNQGNPAYTKFEFEDEICGVMDTSVMSGFMVMYIDYEYLEYLFSTTPNAQNVFGPTSLYIQTPSEEITNKINSYLASTEKYTGSLEDTFANMFDSMSSTIGTSLVVISCISLLVSAMMILVVLYMSVSERTKEIGVLKSIGARRNDIKRIFTSESFLIGVLSGLCGIIFNLILTLIVYVVLINVLGLAPISYRWWYFAVAMGISILISMLSGLYPASKAAKLDPVESLRRE